MTPRGATPPLYEWFSNVKGRQLPKYAQNGSKTFWPMAPVATIQNPRARAYTALSGQE